MKVSRKKSIEIALRHCATEPVHTPGVIQPNGALIAVDRATSVISFASENVYDFLQVGYAELLGLPVHDVLGTALDPDHDADRAAFGPLQASHCWGLRKFGENQLFLSRAAAGAFDIYEFERSARLAPVDEECAGLKKLIASSQCPELAFDPIVRNLAAWTGYDRALLFKFLDNGDGEVLAEACGRGVRPFLGLRFPAWDIPPQARALMQKTKFRYISDVDACPVPVRASKLSLPALDMTFAHLRGTSPLHLEYLRNMSAAAVFTLNVVVNGRLWGMITLHHAEARVPDPTLRAACISVSAALQDAIERFSDRLRMSPPRSGDFQLIAQDEGVPKPNTDPVLIDFAAVRVQLNADCAILFEDGGITASGCPVPAQFALSCLLKHKWPFGVTTSSDLAADFPEIAAQLGETFGGMLVVKVTETRVFCFLRLNKPGTVNWAGRPEKTVVIEEAQHRLQPRGSFGAYKEVLADHCNPWTFEEIWRAESLCEVSNSRASAASPSANPETMQKTRSDDIVEGAPVNGPSDTSSFGLASSAVQQITSRALECLLYVSRTNARSDTAVNLANAGLDTVRTATNPKAALQDLARRRPDLACVDASGGISPLAQRLLLELRAQSIPILLLRDENEATTPVLHLRPDAVLERSCASERLAATILRIVP